MLLAVWVQAVKKVIRLRSAWQEHEGRIKWRKASYVTLCGLALSCFACQVKRSAGNNAPQRMGTLMEYRELKQACAVDGRCVPLFTVAGELQFIPTGIHRKAEEATAQKMPTPSIRVDFLLLLLLLLLLVWYSRSTLFSFRFSAGRKRQGGVRASGKI